ncbi:MAG: FAD:protein FMN transferase [Bacteriovoracia bacterium]
MNWIQVCFEQNHMATTFRFVVSCVSTQRALAERVLESAHRLVSALEAELTEFQSTSPIFRLNQAAVGEAVILPAHALGLLARSEQLREATEGAFDCTAKSVTPLAPGARVGFDLGARTAWRNDTGVRVGFGAIGKGYALDEVRRLLEAEGFTNYLLTAGGSSILFSGYAAPRQAWEWGWSWMKDAQGEDLGLPFSHETGQSVALGISGLHEKGEHLLDPVQGGRATRARSALVSHASAADADALSTALFVAGWDRAMGFLQKLNATVGTALIDEAETPRWNGIFQALWGAPVANFSVKLALAIAAMGGIMGGILSTAGSAYAEEGIDLSALDGAAEEIFNPYDYERNRWWLLLPVFAFLLVCLHLKKFRMYSNRRRKSEAP